MHFEILVLFVILLHFGLKLILENPIFDISGKERLGYK